jgi:hypothetical protein
MPVLTADAVAQGCQVGRRLVQRFDDHPPSLHLHRMLTHRNARTRRKVLNESPEAVPARSASRSDTDPADTPRPEQALEGSQTS